MIRSNTELQQEIDLNGSRILITGAAGFIGSNLVLGLLSGTEDSIIVGIDNLNDYYDVELKRYRLSLIQRAAEKSGSKFVFYQQDITDKEAIKKLFESHDPIIVVNLAAQAGVRYSIENPDAYIQSNIVGFFNILEGCRHNKELKHLIYASSSSVYGGNIRVPFDEEDPVDNPVSLYAATKKSDELLAYSYAKLYNIPCTGLRFFTVYGPAGRPDMAYFSFTEKLRRREKIKVFNFGDCRRDFTYVDDIKEGVIRVMKEPPGKAVGKDGLPIPPYRIYNIGNSSPERLTNFIHILSEELVRIQILPASFNVEEYMELVPMQPGDVPVTYADTKKLERDFSFKPSTPLRDGLRKFAEWYKDYYAII